MSDEKPVTLKSLVLPMILGMIFGTPVWIFKGWIVVQFWAWFVTPAFGLPTPSLAVAIGLSLTVSLLTATRSSSKKEGEPEITANYVMRNLADSILGLVVTFVFGWVTHLFL